MSYIVIFILTILCCLIFEKLGIQAIVLRLSDSYRSQLATMKDKAISDEERQKALLKQTPVQLIYLAKLLGSILLFISPFLVFLIFQDLMPWFRIELLYSVYGILVSLVAVFAYILLKKIYVKLFKR